jgi:hypothetical protein
MAHVINCIETCYKTCEKQMEGWSYTNDYWEKSRTTTYVERRLYKNLRMAKR